MKELIVDIPGIPASQYPIVFCETLHKTIYDYSSKIGYSKLAVVIDSNVYRLWKDKLQLGDAVVIVQSEIGEKQKELNAISKIWSKYKEYGIDRKGLVVHIGGGATIDAASFATSTYMRGLRFINIPTTLLSQVDSSIGGKNGINLDGIKNLIGTFTQPTSVLIDSSFLATLPKNEFNSGYAEIIKHGLISDITFFESLEKQSNNDANLLSIISHSCALKSNVVAIDPLEHGIRKILNFGHTIGHALEAYSQKTDRALLHGEAISIGMVAEAWISKKLGFISESDFSRIPSIFKKYNLPITFSLYPEMELMHLMKSDKKNQGGNLQFALLNSLGSCDYDIEVSEDIVKESLNFVRQ